MIVVKVNVFQIIIKTFNYKDQYQMHLIRILAVCTVDQHKIGFEVELTSDLVLA